MAQILSGKGLALLCTQYDADPVALQASVRPCQVSVAATLVFQEDPVCLENCAVDCKCFYP